MRRRVRAAAVISEFIGIPPHLSLSPGVRLVVDFPLDPATAGNGDNRSGPENDNVLSSKPRKRNGLRARGCRLARSRGLADFALMAWIAANVAPTIALCSSGSSMSIHGITAMYLLMSLFHLPPWLKLASSPPWAGA